MGTQQIRKRILCHRTCQRPLLRAQSPAQWQKTKMFALTGTGMDRTSGCAACNRFQVTQMFPGEFLNNFHRTSWTLDSQLMGPYALREYGMCFIVQHLGLSTLTSALKLTPRACPHGRWVMVDGSLSGLPRFLVSGRGRLPVSRANAPGQEAPVPELA